MDFRWCLLLVGYSILGAECMKGGYCGVCLYSLVVIGICLGFRIFGNLCGALFRSYVFKLCSFRGTSQVDWLPKVH